MHRRVRVRVHGRVRVHAEPVAQQSCDPRDAAAAPHAGSPLSRSCCERLCPEPRDERVLLVLMGEAGGEGREREVKLKKGSPHPLCGCTPVGSG